MRYTSASQVAEYSVFTAVRNQVMMNFDANISRRLHSNNIVHCLKAHTWIIPYVGDINVQVLSDCVPNVIK